MRDSKATRAEILKAAAALFAAHGYEGTTFLKVSEASDAAVGSITHFFGDKGGLAAHVYEHVMSELAADAEAALRGHTNDVEAAIHELISACLGWGEKFPNHRRLIRMLDPHLAKSNRTRSGEWQDALPKILADWANRLPSNTKVMPLSPDQLYAVLLAPVMYAGTSADSSQSDLGPISIDWVTLLTRAALGALAPPRRKAGSQRAGSRQGKAALRDLL